MTGWLKRKVDAWSIGEAAKQFDDFFARLSTMNSDEIGLPLALATEFRHTIDEGLPTTLLDPIVSLVAQPALITELVRQTQELQRQNPALAAGMLIWVHTLRTANDLRLRDRGRALWQELGRGIPYVLTARDDFFAATGMRLRTDGCNYIPIGLEPRS